MLLYFIALLGLFAEELTSVVPCFLESWTGIDVVGCQVDRYWSRALPTPPALGPLSHGLLIFTTKASYDLQH